MTYRELQQAFEIIALHFVNVEEKPTSQEIEFWLNRGKDKFIKTRYSGINFKREGFEQDQKRIDDLRTLVSTKTYDVGNQALVTIPVDYMFLLGETVWILPTDDNKDAIECWDKYEGTNDLIPHRSDVLEATIENVDRQLQNSLSEHRLHRGYARPLRLIRNKNIYFYTDDTYFVDNYEITYLRTPKNIDLHTNPVALYTDMSEHTHEEIVKLAVEMFLENRQSPRYQSFLNEVSTME